MNTSPNVAQGSTALEGTERTCWLVPSIAGVFSLELASEAFATWIEMQKCVLDLITEHSRVGSTLTRIFWQSVDSTLTRSSAAAADFIRGMDIALGAQSTEIVSSEQGVDVATAHQEPTFSVLDTLNGGQDILIGRPDLDLRELLDTVPAPLKAAAARAGE